MSLATNPRHVGRYREVENAIMDRHDARVPIGTIAREFNMRRKTVASVIAYMRLNRADVLQSPLAHSAATQALATAIARVHPERVAG